MGVLTGSFHEVPLHGDLARARLRRPCCTVAVSRACVCHASQGLPAAGADSALCQTSSQLLQPADRIVAFICVASTLCSHSDTCAAHHTCTNSSYVIVMADGIAPAIDKVGAPEPTAPEAQAGAPTMDTTKPVLPPPVEASKPATEKKIPDGAGPAVGAPKAVTVMSVPQTPINNLTPAGGSPRPELKLDEPKEPPKAEEATVILGIQEPTSTPIVSGTEKGVEATLNGASKAAEASADSDDTSSEKKRKLGEEGATNGDVLPSDKPEPDSKKARVEEVEDVEPATNGKNGKAKKQKKRIPAAGLAARKTRSQGPVDV
ncbi:hypothetical protein G7046_g5937 [Stylonectria norvegica]|nr:hypothetical protein G7046_g5937 [Stylonectria norvegica]